jgi:hypothetical protein
MIYETEEELRAAVEEVIPDLSDKDWYQHTPDHPAPYRDSERLKILAALTSQKKNEHLEESAKEEIASRIENIPAPHNTLISMPNDLKSLTEKTRKYLFGITEPPFKDVHSAMPWIESIYSEEENIDKKNIFNAYCKKLKDRFECRDTDAGLYMLIGKLPFLPAVDFSSRYNKMAGQWELTLKIREPISDEELLGLFRPLRMYIWKMDRGPKKITEKDDALVEFITPKLDTNHGVKPHWEPIMKDWNKKCKSEYKHPEWQFANSNSIRMAYRRVKNKIHRKT